MTATKAAKCANSVCSCQTTSGKFCSTQCEAMQKTSDIDCSCGHIECTGNLLTLNSARMDTPSRVYHQKKMRNLRRALAMLTLCISGVLVGCFGAATKSPEVSDNIRKSLDQAGFKDVSVTQDRDRGVVTLGGSVTSQNDKVQAQILAKSLAGSQVVADQIAVLPLGSEKDAKAMNSDLDRGIEKNLDAALIQNKMHDIVSYLVKSGVVTLTGEVNSQSKRELAEKVASDVPNVQQVVNDLQVKNQKAGSSE